MKKITKERLRLAFVELKMVENDEFETKKRLHILEGEAELLRDNLMVLKNQYFREAIED